MLPYILRYPNFKKLYFAGFTSELGSFITETALMLAIFDIGGKDKSLLGLARAIFLIFLTIGNLLGGSLGEKYNKKNILLFSNYMRIPFVISLFFANSASWFIFVDGMIAFFTGIYNPTRQSLTNDLVPGEDISKANGLFGSTFAILHMIGPFLGAFLYTQFRGVSEVLSFDLFTYFVGIFLIGSIKYNKVSDNKPGKYSVINDVGDALKFVFKRKDLFALITTASSAGFCIGFLIPLLLPYFTEVLGVDKRAYGIAFSCFGLGGLIGGWLGGKLSERFYIGRIVVTSLMLEPIMMILWLQTKNFYLSCFLFFLWGVVVLVSMTNQLNYISHKVESEYMTRVFSLLDLTFVAPNIISGIIVSLIGKQFTTLEILESVSILFVIMIIPRIFFKDMRTLLSMDNERVERDKTLQDEMETP
ncbi:MAG: hypothetical protein CME69_03230 [Halobacteriovorax sp.]|nr:hypothetical protein [Halobacteriovorax sp.]